MTIEVFEYHSVRTDLLTGGYVLDVGCRGFDFARGLAARGCKVIALDPDIEVTDPHIEGVNYLRCALVGQQPGTRELVVTGDPQARFIKPSKGFPDGCTASYRTAPTLPVSAYTLSALMRLCKVEAWDVVKFNCEGEEAEVLPRWPGPVARQIVVSFHEHYRPIGEDAIADIVRHLGQWYTPVTHAKEARYGGGMNYWDSLFVLKELA